MPVGSAPTLDRQHQFAPAWGKTGESGIISIMTIEMGVKIPNGETVKIGSIAPGEFGSFSDFSSGILETLVVFCSEDDQGGEVYCVRDEGFVVDVRHRLVPSELLTSETREASLATGETYERRVVTRLQQLGTLSLTHCPK